MRSVSLVRLWFFCSVALGSAFAAAALPSANLIRVAGGAFKNTHSNFNGRAVIVPTFYLGKYEVTQREWTEVMGGNPSQFVGDDLPVETVSWYDCIEYCNRRSAKEGLQPYYTIEREKKDPNNLTVVDDVKWTVTTNPGANGYRLPTEIEWEYAATGGQESRDFTYSGDHDLDKVGWFWQNAGDRFLEAPWSWPRIQQNHNHTKPVGSKAPNELGFFDMSGNVREWCWDWYGERLDEHGLGPTQSSAETGRVWKGGGWIGGDFCCAPSFRASHDANGKGPDQGLRVCRGE